MGKTRSRATKEVTHQQLTSKLFHFEELLFALEEGLKILDLDDLFSVEFVPFSRFQGFY